MRELDGTAVKNFITRLAFSLGSIHDLVGVVEHVFRSCVIAPTESDADATLYRTLPASVVKESIGKIWARELDGKEVQGVGYWNVTRSCPVWFNHMKGDINGRK